MLPEKLRVLVFELVCSFSHFVREGLPAVSSSHRKMRLDIWPVIQTPFYFRVCLRQLKMAFALMGCVSFLHPVTDADLLLPCLNWVPSQCTGLWCGDLYSDPAEISTTIAVFFNLTRCLTSKAQLTGLETFSYFFLLVNTTVNEIFHVKKIGWNLILELRGESQNLIW